MRGGVQAANYFVSSGNTISCNTLLRFQVRCAGLKLTFRGKKKKKKKTCSKRGGNSMKVGVNMVQYQIGLKRKGSSTVSTIHTKNQLLSG